jgi:ADP-ribosylglycohydrolase
MEVMRRHGADFTSLDMASLWAQQLPVLATCTAERAAFNQFLEGWLPPRCASRRNPYREWIGAQIRADFFGYAAPGNAARAAEWAWRDASVSHVKNGIYGEMWVAAMLASAYVLSDWPAIIRAGLAQIPRRSRLREGIERILAAHAAGVSREEVVGSIHREWDELTAHGWVHTICNAQVVAAALLYGKDDFTTTISHAVSTGFDTDCNGATCGSLWGVRHGAKALPPRWLSPLRNKLKTNLSDYPVMPLDEMAERMVTVAQAVRGHT